MTSPHAPDAPPETASLPNAAPTDQLTPSVTASSFTALKERIRHHYELASEYYYSLWGEHIHHGYFLTPTDTKERAQIQLIELLIQRSELPKESTVLDVGCGIGGTSRWLASNHDCQVTGITISGKQVEMATKLTSDASKPTEEAVSGGPINLNNGTARFLELDAETMGDFFADQTDFDCVWISEAMSHLPNKELFFRNAFQLLRKGGKLVIADWFKAEDLTEQQMADDIKPIEGKIPPITASPSYLLTARSEDGMLLPPLCTQSAYVAFAQDAGFKIHSAPFDISGNVAKT
ncbi:MAG: hypothetical protein Q9168_003918, partial [Polycauliona sp. 1 TL-2023]